MIPNREEVSIKQNRSYETRISNSALPYRAGSFCESVPSCLGLAAGAAGCKATQTPTQVDSPDAQTPPLTPQEWVQRNFQKPADKPVGQAPTLMAELRPVPQTTNSSLPPNPRNQSRALPTWQIRPPARRPKPVRRLRRPTPRLNPARQPRVPTLRPSWSLRRASLSAPLPTLLPRRPVGKSAGQSTGFSGHPDQ